MDEKPDQIINHIESQRDQLGRNLGELESRVKGATDWRTQFDRNPMLMMGLALGGGLLIGTMTGSSRKSGSRQSSTPWSSSSRYTGGSSSTPIGSSSSSSYGSSPASSYGSSPASSFGASSTSPALREQRKKATDTLEHIKAAMIGFATAKVKEFLHEALPGFGQHLEEAERRNPSNSGQQDQSQQHQYHSEANPSTGSGGSTRSEFSGQSPYRQEPVGANTGSNI